MPHSPPSPSIILNEEEHLIARGAYCSCYHHPEQPNRCIKLTTGNQKAKKRLRAELQYYQKLHRLGTDLSRVSDYLGTCETNLGTGHLFECIIDSNGQPSKTVEHLLKSKKYDPATLFPELKTLAEDLLKKRIMVCDLHARNILLQERDGEAPRAILIDGAGDRVAIPLLNLIDSLVVSKITRRWNRFIIKLQAAFPEIEMPASQLQLPVK